MDKIIPEEDERKEILKYNHKTKLVQGLINEMISDKLKYLEDRNDKEFDIIKRCKVNRDYIVSAINQSKMIYKKIEEQKRLKQQKLEEEKLKRDKSVGKLLRDKSTKLLRDKSTTNTRDKSTSKYNKNDRNAVSSIKTNINSHNYNSLSNANLFSSHKRGMTTERQALSTNYNTKSKSNLKTMTYNKTDANLNRNLNTIDTHMTNNKSRSKLGIPSSTSKFNPYNTTRQKTPISTHKNTNMSRNSNDINIGTPYMNTQSSNTDNPSYVGRKNNFGTERKTNVTTLNKSTNKSTNKLRNDKSVSHNLNATTPKSTNKSINNFKSITKTREKTKPKSENINGNNGGKKIL